MERKLFWEVFSLKMNSLRILKVELLVIILVSLVTSSKYFPLLNEYFKLSFQNYSINQLQFLGSAETAYHAVFTE